MKILGIVGSQRKKGNTAILVEEALQSFKNEGIETQTLFLGDYDIKDCIGCEGCKDTYKCVIKDGMQEIYPLLWEADAIILASPTYFYNVTAVMKAFLDRCYCFDVFADDDRSVWLSINEVIGIKYATVIAVCEQHNNEDMGFTADTMKLSLEAIGYRVVDTVKILGAYAKEEVLQNNTALLDANKAGKKLLKMLKLREKVEVELNKIQVCSREYYAILV